MIRQPVSERSIRVWVADRQSLVRKGICALLAAEPDLEMVGKVAALADIVDVVERSLPSAGDPPTHGALPTSLPPWRRKSPASTGCGDEDDTQGGAT
jgi:hypothetical protein